jgi:thiaminase/transcriptional activator TenA
VSFSADLWDEASEVWRAIREHPFIGGVRDGTLPLDTFRYYLTQDYLYLEAFGRAVAQILAKSPDSDALRLVARRVMTPIERPHHEGLFALVGLERAAVERAAVAPTNMAYQNHMLVSAERHDLGVGAAALLPCPWTYHALGDVLRGTTHPIYGQWASAYAEGLLEQSRAAWRGFVDAEAEIAGRRQLDAMRAAFHTSMRYEWMFWEMGYRRERWPI